MLRLFLCSFSYKGVWIGYTFTGFLVAAGARPGGVYHIGQSSFFLSWAWLPSLERVTLQGWNYRIQMTDHECAVIYVYTGFPVFARGSFGIFGSLWPVFNRAAMAW